MQLELSTPPAIPQEAIEKINSLLQTGKLHRYAESANIGEEVANLEVEFAALIGRKYAIAMNSCGSTMFIALKAAGVKAGDKVLMNAFTLAPVPGSIAHAGATPILVEMTENLTIDLADLEEKAQTSAAKYLLLSHMRGHIADMDKILEICKKHEISLIEDCAHTLGASWAGVPTGKFGIAGCFSLQSYKHVNAGEGGILVTDDDDIAAKAILHSGSYMMYHHHKSRPSLDVFERHKYHTPNFSLRMSNFAAILARPQLPLLQERGDSWNVSYNNIAKGLAEVKGIALPHRPQAESYVQSSIQFLLKGYSELQIQNILADCAAQGLFVKWFGAVEPVGFTAQSSSWHYIENAHTPPKTKLILEKLCDIRLPLTLTKQQAEFIVATISTSCNKELGKLK